MELAGHALALALALDALNQFWFVFYEPVNTSSFLEFWSTTRGPYRWFNQTWCFKLTNEEPAPAPAGYHRPKTAVGPLLQCC